MSNCRSCGAPIIFVLTKNGKQMPMDAAGAPCPDCSDGNAALTANCAKCSGTGRIGMPHFATCDKPEAFRRPR